jgi:hypothetical protein
VTGSPPSNRRPNRPRLKLQLGELVNLSGAFYLAVVALTELGRRDAAAVLIGAADALDANRADVDWGIDGLGTMNDGLLDALGEERFATLTARGAALEIADAVAYLRAEADSALLPTEQRAVSG